MSKDEQDGGPENREGGTAAAGKAFARALARDGRRAGAAGWKGLRRGAAGAASGTAAGIAALRARRAARAAERSDEAPEADRGPGPRAERRGRRFPLGRVLGLGTLAVFAALGVFAIGVYLTLPGLDEVRARSDDRVVFEDATGAPLMTRGTVPSDYATLAQMPAHLPQAVIAIEDRRFYEHGGLDFQAIARAFMRNARSGDIVQGGSTLTQQLVKISYLEPERSYRRKLHEAILTRQLERRDSKEAILEAYLNSVYLGAGATGMPAAARVYFDVGLDALTVAQSAALAAMIQAPSVVNPFADLPALRERATLTVNLMEAQGYLTAEEARQARAEVAVLAPQRPEAKYGTWFADWVAREADALPSSRRSITVLRTTLEPQLQMLAERAIAGRLEAAGSGAQAALVALRPDGSVAAMVGGRNYAESQFNRAVDAMRQPGSTFKTVVYLAALAEGFKPGDRILDRQLDIDGYTPSNFDNRYRGEVTMLDAFAGSLNAATVNLAMTVGLDRIVETAHQLGIDTELRETPALALGASEVPLIEMTEAYGAIATGRMPFRAYGIKAIAEEAGGTFITLRRAAPASGPELARLDAARQDMATLLRRVIDGGTGKRAALPQPAAGKTGTSQESRDALFIGWSGDLITGVWIGNDDNSPMNDVTGGGLPAEIWADFMRAALSDAPVESSRKGAEGDTVETIARKLGATAPAEASCDIRACSRAYRSFRASDCTFQPYRGGRKLCTK